MAQARLKLKIHCGMQDKLILVQHKAIVHKRALCTVQMI